MIKNQTNSRAYIDDYSSDEDINYQMIENKNQ